ncbi:proton-coupled zinc antiporter SLC30A1-like isoform X2 [Tachypleus tridentatus]
MSPKKWTKNTFGWARAEVLGALVNSIFLMALCFSIFVEALKRFFEPEEIHNPVLILYVGGAGLLVNVIGLFLFHEHGHSHGGHSHSGHSHDDTSRSKKKPQEESGAENVEIFNVDSKAQTSSEEEHHVPKKKAASSSQMNMKGVFLHVLADALGSVIVIISALIIWLTGWKYRFYVDPALSVVMVCLIMASTCPLFIDSAKILLQTVPTHIQVDTLENKLLQKVEGVVAVHEFHVWQLAGNRIIASAHILCQNLSQYMEVAEKIKEFFHEEGIHSTTIQPEFVELKNLYPDKENCVLGCPSKGNCKYQTCCGPQEVKSPNVMSGSYGETICTSLTLMDHERASSCGLDIRPHSADTLRSGCYGNFKQITDDD